MVNKSGTNVKKLLSVIVILIAVLALAFPAQASEYNPPASNLVQTPTVEINPDANHHDHASGDFIRVPLSLAELAASSCSGDLAAEYPMNYLDQISL